MKPKKAGVEKGKVLRIVLTATEFECLARLCYPPEPEVVRVLAKHLLLDAASKQVAIAQS